MADQLESLVQQMLDAGVADDKVKEFVRQYTPSPTLAQSPSTSPSTPPPSSGESGGFISKALPLATRVIPQAIGSFGGPWFGAGGGILGEGLAEAEEKYFGTRQDYSPAELAAAGVIGAVPFSGPAKGVSVARAVLTQAGKGAALGAASNLIQHGFKGELPTAGELATNTAAGAVLGGVTQGVLGKLAKPGIAAAVEKEDPILQRIQAAHAANETPAAQAHSPEPIAPPIQNSPEPIIPSSPSATTAASPDTLPSQGPAPPLNPGKRSLIFDPEVGTATDNPKADMGGATTDYSPALPKPDSIPTQPLPPKAVLDFKSIQKMPEEYHSTILDLMERNGGFEGQRRGVQPIERTDALASELAVPLTRGKVGMAYNAEELASYRDALASNFQKQQGLAEKINSGNYTNNDMVQFAQVNQDAVALLATYRGGKAEAGRALNILKYNARVMDYGYSSLVDKMMDTPGFKDNMAEVAKAVAAAGGDPVKQLQLLRNAKSTSLDKFMSLYYNSLLSTFPTQVRNVLGNTANLVLNLSQPLVGGPIDMVRSAVTGQERQVFTSEAGKGFTAFISGLKPAWENMMHTIQEGFTPIQVAEAGVGKFDTGRAEAPGGILTNWPSRLLEGADQFYRTLGTQVETNTNAYARALKEGLTNPQQITDRMTQLITGTGKESLDIFNAGEKFGARSVFQEKPGGVIGGLIGIKQALVKDHPLMGQAINFLIPFVRTPGNIIKQGMEASPLGMVMKPIKSEVKGLLNPKLEGVWDTLKTAASGDTEKLFAGGNSTREGAQAMGRAGLGSLVLVPFALLAIEGRITGDAPQDPGEREAFYREGKLPNAVKIGDKWVSYQNMQPLSTPLAAVANAWQAMASLKDNQQAASTKVKNAILGSVNSVLDTSFLSGLNSFLESLKTPATDESRASAALNSFSQSLVPGSGMLRGITRVVDPVAKKPEGSMEAIQAIIPGLSQGVTPRRDIFGKPVETGGGPIQRAILPGATSEKPINANTDISDMLAKYHIQPTQPATNLKDKDGKPIPLTGKQKDVIAEAIGADRVAKLAPFVNSNVPAKRIQSIIESSSTDVHQRALNAIRRGEPLTPEMLSPRGFR